MNKFTKKQILYTLKNVKRGTWIRLIIAVVLIVLCGILQIIKTRTVNSLPDEHAASRFAPEGNYAEIAVFFSEGAGIETDRRREFYYRMGEALTNNAIESESEDEDARLYIDAASADGTATLTHEKKSVEANVIGTDGDFFSIHPVELVSGMYYSADALMQDHILVDEDVAWQLYGSSNIAGQSITIGSNLYFISGVVKSASGRLREAAGSYSNLVYMPLSALESDGSFVSGDAGMSCYEIVMPDPVSGFAKKLVQDTLSFGETEAEVVDVTSRYSLFNIYKLTAELGVRSMTGNAVRYPYWENMARGIEDIVFAIVMAQTLCIVILSVMLVYVIVQSYRHKKWTARGLYENISDYFYELGARKQANKNKLTIINIGDDSGTEK